MAAQRVGVSQPTGGRWLTAWNEGGVDSCARASRADRPRSSPRNSSKSSLHFLKRANPGHHRRSTSFSGSATASHTTERTWPEFSALTGYSTRSHDGWIRVNHRTQKRIFASVSLKRSQKTPTMSHSCSAILDRPTRPVPENQLPELDLGSTAKTPSTQWELPTMLSPQD